MTTSTTTVVSTEHETKEQQTAQLLRHAAEFKTKPLWTQMTRLNPPAPNPTCTPHVWRYDEIRPHLLRAGELVTEKQAERRVLMLTNPSRDAPYTTDTIYAGLQLVMPNETAPAHRHTAFACRFIIEGQGGFTAVHGRRIHMERGDLILTPTWNWHDHGKDGAGPMIWLDTLDLPNFMHFPVHFVEHFEKARYPAEDVDSATSPIVFPWREMKAALDREEGDVVTRRYLKEDGREISRILGASATRLEAGLSIPSVQETASFIVHVVEGTGHSIINGVRLDWKKGDTFCIPSWNEYVHTADAGEDVYLYHVDEKPMLKSLGFYRKAGEDSEGLVSD